MCEERIRKVFLDNLPRYRYGKGQPNGVIDWKECAKLYSKVKFIWDDIEGEIKIVEYRSKGQKLYIKYLNKPIFEISTANFMECKLGTMLGKITSNFKIEIGQNFKNEKRDIIIIDRKYMKDDKGRNWKYYKYKCNVCGYACGEYYRNGEYKEELWSEENHLINGGGCSCCCVSPYATVCHINSIVANKETYWMIPYFQGGYDEAKKYTKSANMKITPICPDCGRVKDKAMMINTIYNNKSISCSCSDGKSYSEKLAFSLLEQLHIDFIMEYSPKWVDKKRYDFYIPSKKIIVEMDGIQHKEYKSFGNKCSTLNEQMYNDKSKDRLAQKHNIEVIRIDCEFSNLDYIKNNILSSKLNEIFDLSKVNWVRCEEFALSNLVKRVCKIKKDNPEISTTKISEIVNVKNITIIRYLKMGVKLGWCNYNPKEEKLKGCSNSGKMNGKPVEIYSNGIKLGTFPSVMELSRQSENLFDVNLNYASISLIASGKRGNKSYKGFTFKYTQPTTPITQPQLD